jgi:hypothetical protein
MIAWMTWSAWLGRACALALAGVSLALPVQAQQNDGWFEEPSPAASAPPTPSTVGDKEPLAPSPLLEEDSVPLEDGALDRDPRALTYWNDELAPYGVWVNDPSYGRVWVPHAHVVGTQFAPYVSSGHWGLDELDQWVWVSDYPFGGVVFHYGRWVWISGRGWAWIPGLGYAPAWVAWRTPVGGYGYVGWAPLPPAWVWFGGVAVVYGYGPYYPWVFCPSAYLFHRHVHYYIVHDHYRIAHAARHTRPYHPASPRPAGHRAAAPASPSMRAANVPPSAIPRERVSSRRLAAEHSPRVSAAPGLRARPGISSSRPAPGARGKTPKPERIDAAPLLRREPRRSSRSAAPRLPAPKARAAPAPRPERAPTDLGETTPGRTRATPKARPAPSKAPSLRRERLRPESAPRRIDAPRRSPGGSLKGTRSRRAR